MERRPDWVILNTIPIAGRHRNGSTARDVTRHGQTIEASFSLRHPPRPSILFVHSADMNLAVAPHIVATADDLLLLSVNVGWSGPSSLSPNDCDFFVYRAHPTSPSLRLLGRPHPYFNRSDAGVLPRPDGHFTVAALVATGTCNQYELHRFHSDESGWSSCMLFVEAPQREFPVKIPVRSNRLHWHRTSKVITIGGEGGTMGWVDLWRGIIFCDVLHTKPSLRGVPLPMPLKELSYNHGEGLEFGPPAQRRGISFVRDDDMEHDGCLRLIHLEISDVRLPGTDEETDAPSFRVDNWVLTTWSNTRMTDSFEDWRQDYTVQGSDIVIDDPTISHVLHSSGLLPVPEQMGLHNLGMSQPALSFNGEEEVVYLVARKKYKRLLLLFPSAWFLIKHYNN